MSNYSVKHDIGWAIGELALALKYLADKHYEAVKLQTDIIKNAQSTIVDIYGESVDKIMEKK